MFGRKIKLKWLGEEYTLNTTFEMAEEIDEQVNILKTSIDIDSGGVPKVTTVAKLYSVSSIPHTILLDQEGRIIARKLRSPQLEQVLAEIFGS